MHILLNSSASRGKSYLHCSSAAKMIPSWYFLLFLDILSQFLSRHFASFLLLHCQVLLPILLRNFI